jgi:hypothetical protein
VAADSSGKVFIMIDQCAFGSMRIGGRVYRSDLMIFPDGRVQEGWRRAEGHRLSMSDLGQVLAAEPMVIVAGTGIFGRVRLEADLVEQLSLRGIRLVARRTKTAAQEFNGLRLSELKLAGCFHLTC